MILLSRSLLSVALYLFILAMSNSSTPQSTHQTLYSDAGPKYPSSFIICLSRPVLDFTPCQPIPSPRVGETIAQYLILPTVTLRWC